MGDNEKMFSIAEVAENNGKNGKPIWLIIKDSVFDVTGYLDDHPGGGDLLQGEAGKDATKPFNDFGHSGDAKAIMKKFKIGELRPEDRKQPQSKKDKELKVKIAEDVKNNRSCISIVTCGCLG